MKKIKTKVKLLLLCIVIVEIFVACNREILIPAIETQSTKSVEFDLYNKASQEIPPIPIAINSDQTFDDSNIKKFTGGDAPKFYIGKSRIEVKNLNKERDLAIKLEISKTINSAGDYNDINSTDNYTNLYNSAHGIYSITKLSLSTINPNISLQNNRYLRITAYDKSSGSPNSPLLQAVYLNKKQIEFCWQIKPNDLFFTPILFRVTGNVSGFNLGSITPSIGGRLIKLNLNSYFIDNINLSAFISITNYGTNNIVSGYQYSLATGGFIDLGGNFQLGGGYSFIEHKPYVVVGFSSALFSKIFGNQ